VRWFVEDDEVAVGCIGGVDQGFIRIERTDLVLLLVNVGGLHVLRRTVVEVQVALHCKCAASRCLMLPLRGRWLFNMRVLNLRACGG